MKALMAGVPPDPPPTPVDTVSRIEPETETYDTASLLEEPHESQIQETIERSVAESIARISEATVEKMVQQITGPLASAIAEKVCEEMNNTLSARIENTLQEVMTKARSKPARPAAKRRKKIEVDGSMSPSDALQSLPTDKA